ncbi:MAG: glycosyltransferase family 4 protein [Burkholderiaceae bacterium]
MKLLITDIHHGNGGGHVTYILSLIEGLKHEYDITVAAPPTGRLYQRVAQMQGVRAVPGLYTSRLLTLMREVRALRAFLRAEGFDVVHVNGGADHRHVMLATLGMPGRPGIVWTKHNTNQVASIGHRLRARFGTHASIAVCEYVAQILQASAYRSHPIQVVRNGIDVETLSLVCAAKKTACREALFGPLPDDTLVLGSIGGTDYNKGWHLLLEAAGRLPQPLRGRLRFVIAGDPPSGQMMKLVEQSGVASQVCFPGLVSDIRAILGACDAGFVLSYREAASYASCETMAMGLPALVSDAGGLPENVRHGVDGWVVPVGDVDAIEAVLRDMLAQPEKLCQMGHMARARVASAFSIPQFIHDTKAVYGLALALARPSVTPI